MAGYDKVIDDSMAEDGHPEDAKKDASSTPTYKMVGDAKIPVSKATGKLWKQRYDQGVQRDKAANEARQEVMRYFHSDQTTRRGKKRKLATLQDVTWETENVVYSNVTSMIPSIYAKNPSVEITTSVEELQNAASMYEKLLHALMNRKVAPGANIKPKIRRATLMALITNIGYVEIGYTKKEDSAEAAMNELGDLSKALDEAKTIEEIREVEGQLFAMEQKIPFLSASGPWVKFRHYCDVINDPNSLEQDQTDATWLMVGEFVATSYIQAVYGEKGEDGKYHSIYYPSHVLASSKNKDGGDRDINGQDANMHSFDLFKQGDGVYSEYGYSDRETFDAACYTKVWYVWDKTTRRVLMFNDKCWDWPIWVFDDPNQLSRFFSVIPLAFTVDPEERTGKAEAFYYLDQQDAINDINSQKARMRYWAANKVFYDKNAVKDEKTIEAFLDGANRLHGVDLEEGKKMTELFGSLPAPATSLVQLFDNTPQMQAISRLSSVTQTMRNAEYKTNTTNKAIDNYESNTQTRLDEKLDSVEEFIGEVGLGLLEMALQNMQTEDVAAIIGEQDAQYWQPMSPRDFHDKFTFQIVGGSTLKPTSKSKKEQATAIVQSLGQFAAASPAIVIVALKILERAFADDVVVSDEDRGMIQESIMAMMNKGRTDQAAQAGGAAGESTQASAGQPQPGVPQPQGAPTPQAAQVQAATNGAGGQADQINQMIEQASQFIQQLPDEVRQQLGQLIAQGVPLTEAAQQLSGQGQQPPQQLQ